MQPETTQAAPEGERPGHTGGAEGTRTPDPDTARAAGRRSRESASLRLCTLRAVPMQSDNECENPAPSPNVPMSREPATPRVRFLVASPGRGVGRVLGS